MSHALLAATVLVAAQPEAPLQRAIDLYWNGEYSQTLSVLSGGALDSLATEDRVASLSYRAFSLVALGRNDEARADFAALLRSDPGHRLDTSIVSPKIVEQFELARSELVEQLFGRGKESYFAEDYAGAHDAMALVTRLRPGHALASEYRDLAQAHLDLARQVAAVAPTPAPKPAAPGVYHLTSEITEPVPISQAAPAYPPMDRRNRTEGTVLVMLTIGAGGAVSHARVVRSVNGRLDAAALRAVRTWRYRPARLDGRAVAVYKLVGLRFSLGS